jgi:FixJ family two-component response regulator
MGLPRQDQFLKIHTGHFSWQGKKVIVVIDDDFDILHSLELMLSLCGYHTKLFASAEEFLCAAPTVEAACLVVDIQLGEISGLALVRALYAQGCELPRYS